MTTPPPGKNRLALSTSPYLLQHADNPVDWYPWGEEAFAKARAEGKAVLVSIGYSACHWCHVMEHESFEDPAIAAIMNELFVCVKVDREERPDLDEIYQRAIALMGLQGGWPLNVFVTPDGRPFFGGTYYPPQQRFGRPPWPDLLRRVAEFWAEQRAVVDKQADELTAAIDGLSRFAPGEDDPSAELIGLAAAQLAADFDPVHAGFGGAPKFPPHQALRFLLRRHARAGEERDLELVVRTLRRLAAGGIRDHLGGGFHRYSVDETWLVPHFEKMLYDNAQLARAYVEAHQVTGDEFHAGIAREILDYVLREMTEPAGGFRSATDADSEGREGVFFVWRPGEVRELLGDEADLFCRAYGVTAQGNFVDPHHPPQPGEEGANVLHEAVPPAELAAQTGQTEAEVAERLAAARAVLLEARASRPAPALDDKVLAAWNGLMIGSLAYAGRVLDEPRYLEAAARAATFVLEEMRDEEGRLLRSHRGGPGRTTGFLEDYAYLADGLLDLYEATFELRWLRDARRLADEMNERFADAEAGGWFHTATDGESLIVRVKTPVDGAVPAANAIAVRVMSWLAVLTGEASYRERAERTLRLFGPALQRSPTATLGMLLGLDRLLHEGGEIAVVGDPEAEGTRVLLRRLHAAYLPGTTLALLDPRDAQARAATEELVPLLRGKTLVAEREAVYLCRDYACAAPITDAAALEAALAER